MSRLVAAAVCLAVLAGTAAAEEPLVARGERLSITLRPDLEDFLDATGYAASLFDSSADGLLSVGPNRPNPYSQLSSAVLCRDRLAFAIVLRDAAGDSLETYVFPDVPPGAYRLGLNPEKEMVGGIVSLEYRYGDETLPGPRHLFRDER